MSRTFKDTNKKPKKLLWSKRPGSTVQVLPWYWDPSYNTKEFRKRTARLERLRDKKLCRDLGEDSTWSWDDYDLICYWEEMLDWGYEMESWGPNPIPRKEFWRYGDSERGYGKFQLEQYNMGLDYEDSMHK